MHCKEKFSIYLYVMFSLANGFNELLQQQKKRTRTFVLIVLIFV